MSFVILKPSLLTFKPTDRSVSDCCPTETAAHVGQQTVLASDSYAVSSLCLMCSLLHIRQNEL